LTNKVAINFGKTLYLASRSPRRVELLSQLGWQCVIQPADIDETPLVGEQAAAYVHRLAEQKALAASRLFSVQDKSQAILAADTTVALGSRLLGKPVDLTDARAMLVALSGSVHQVHTAVALLIHQHVEMAYSCTDVEMMRLSEPQIEAYLASGEWQDKAGGYGIQGLAAAWIKRIDGSYSGVMGLPLYETAALLRSQGLSVL
jgi:septum formation protein